MPNTLSPIFYALNNTWLSIIIVKEYLSGFISLYFYVCFSQHAIKPKIVHAIREFCKFPANPYYQEYIIEKRVCNFHIPYQK